MAVSSEGCDITTGSAPSQGNSRHQLLTLSVRGAVLKTDCTRGVVSTEGELAHLHFD